MREFEFRSALSVEEIESFLRQRTSRRYSLTWRRTEKRFRGTVRDGKFRLRLNYQIGGIRADGEIFDDGDERVIVVRVRRAKWIVPLSVILGPWLIYYCWLDSSDDPWPMIALAASALFLDFLVIGSALRASEDADAEKIRGEFRPIGVLVLDSAI